MHAFPVRMAPGLALLLPFLTTLGAEARAESRGDEAFTLYAARISAERTWQHVLKDPIGGEFTDTYLLAAAYSRGWREYRDGAWRSEWEVNVAYNFGEQDHLEVNVAPYGLRWQRFPWSERLHTTVGFVVGLSYALSFPELENRLEGDTTELLIFWGLDVTLGPPEGPWDVVLRLHHRSTGFGLMGVEDGGMNAPGLGFRYRF